jgi:hypothetical protein
VTLSGSPWPPSGGGEGLDQVLHVTTLVKGMPSLLPFWIFDKGGGWSYNLYSALYAFEETVGVLRRFV